MTRPTLTLRSVTARPVVVPLRRPVVSRVGLFDAWPMILIGLGFVLMARRRAAVA